MDPQRFAFLRMIAAEPVRVVRICDARPKTLKNGFRWQRARREKGAARCQIPPGVYYKLMHDWYSTEGAADIDLQSACLEWALDEVRNNL